MSNARHIYRFNLALAAVAISVVALAVSVAVTRIDPALPTLQGIAAICQRMVPIGSDPSGLLVLAFVVIGSSVFAKGIRSLYRQLADQRRFFGGLARLEIVEVDGHRVHVVAGEQPCAFCAGLLRPRIFVSSGTREQLSAEELSAVIAHEAHHQRNRDPSRILIVRLLAESFFFLPVLRRLGDRYRELAELAADDAASAAHSPRILASALLRFDHAAGGNAAVVGIAPERVDHLLGRPPRWQLPLSLLAGSLVSLLALGALVVTAPALIAAQSLSLAVVLAESCMLAMVAVPVAAGGVAIYLSRSRRRLCGHVVQPGFN